MQKRKQASSKRKLADRDALQKKKRRNAKSQQISNSEITVSSPESLYSNNIGKTDAKSVSVSSEELSCLGNSEISSTKKQETSISTVIQGGVTCSSRSSSFSKPAHLGAQLSEKSCLDAASFNGTAATSSVHFSPSVNGIVLACGESVAAVSNGDDNDDEYQSERISCSHPAFDAMDDALFRLENKPFHTPSIYYYSSSQEGDYETGDGDGFSYDSAYETACSEDSDSDPSGLLYSFYYHLLETDFMPWTSYVASHFAPDDASFELSSNPSQPEPTDSCKGNSVAVSTPREDEEDKETLRGLKAREQKARTFDHEFFGCMDPEWKKAFELQRLQMVNWILDYTASYQLQWETLFRCTSLLDRFLYHGVFTNLRHMQALGVASLTLGTRIEENQPYNCIRVHQFRVGNDVFKREEIVAMEWLVLKILNFRCSSPTIADFLWYYLKAVNADGEMEQQARYLACLSLADAQLLGYLPSDIAACLVLTICSVMDKKDSYSLLMEKISNECHEDVSGCIKRLIVLMEKMW